MPSASLVWCAQSCSRTLSQSRSGNRRAGTLFLLLLFCAVTATPSSAQAFATLFTFNGADGNAPDGPLVQGLDGNFYGATQGGGANNQGTIFKVTASGVETVLYSFPAGSNGPVNGLVLGVDGNFYGITPEGGTSLLGGTIFRVTPGGVLTTIFTFCPETNCGTEGWAPRGLVQGSDGNFYGTTVAGGGPNNNGTIFKITPDGTLTTLYRFCTQTSCTDGSKPVTGLVQGSDGNFYGTTWFGGTSSFCAGGCGTAFTIKPAGALTTLYSFCSGSVTNCADGAGVNAALIQAKDGNFYGTTEFYGLNNSGTVFKITSQGTLTTVYNFCAQSGCTDGAGPRAGLVQATDGDFYGATFTDGSRGRGTIFKLIPNGALAVLHTMGPNDIRDGMFQATNGTLYGTTISVNPKGNATIYKLNTRLAQFVSTLPTSGSMGSTVAILGTNLTGATAVKFNGIASTFTFVSSTEITATVPSGATTGTVTVTIPKKTLSSNVPFQVK